MHATAAGSSLGEIVNTAEVPGSAETREFNPESVWSDSKKVKLFSWLRRLAG
jgi:hypothetical protein